MGYDTGRTGTSTPQFRAAWSVAKTIDRYRSPKSSVAETHIEIGRAGASVHRMEGIIEALRVKIGRKQQGLAEQ